jgi:hypothetical protein
MTCRYERDGRGIKTIPAQKLWFSILEAQVETGNPYMLFKDSCNAKSNQQNLGTIKCSNLCTEIVEYTSKDETAVCNLASIALPRCALHLNHGCTVSVSSSHILMRKETEDGQTMILSLSLCSIRLVAD